MKYTREIIIATLVILLLFVSNCSHNQQLKAEGENIQLEKQLKSTLLKLSTQEENRKQLIDSLKKDSDIKIRRIDSLIEENSKKSLKIKELRDKIKRDVATASTYSTYEVAKYLNTKYEVTSTQATQTAVIMTDSVPVKVVEDLIEKSIQDEVINYQGMQLIDKDSIISDTNGLLENKSLELTSANLTIELQKEGLKTSEELVKGKDKVIRKLKVNNFINKVFIIGGVVGGFIIGSQL